MKYVAKIGVPQDFADKIEAILSITEGSSPEFKSDMVIETLTAVFSNGYQADIKVCNGDTPYIDNVLFDTDGMEVHSPEVGETLLDNYEFEDDEDIYEVDVVVDTGFSVETYYTEPTKGVSVAFGDPVHILGERTVTHHNELLEQYIYTIDGMTTENGKPFIALRANIIISK